MSSPTPRNRPAPGPQSRGDKQPGGDQPEQDAVFDIWTRYKRFGWDALGLFLLSLALLTVLGLVGLTQGSLIDPWISLIKTGLGYGSPLVAVALAILGLVCFRHHFKSWPNFPLGRILALEGVAFCALTLLSIFGGLSLDAAEAGEDGGVIGWGLAVLLDRLLPTPGSTIFVLVLGLFLLGLGLGILQWGLREIENAVEKLSMMKPADRELETVVKPESEQPAEAESEAPISIVPLFRDPTLPPLNLLMEEQAAIPDERIIQETGTQIEKTLAEFGLPVRVMGYRIGPTITQFAVEPGFIDKTGPDGEVIQQKVRVAQISALQRDLALSLSAERLQDRGPGPRTLVRWHRSSQSEEYRGSFAFFDGE